MTNTLDPELPYTRNFDELKLRTTNKKLYSILTW